MIYYKAWGTGHVVIFLLPHSALCVREHPRRYEKRLTRCQTPVVPLALAPANASHMDVVVTAASAVPRVTVASLAAPAVAVTAASVVPLALAAAPTATHVAVTAASAVPRVTVASLAAPAVAVTAASEGKQTHKYHRRLQRTGQNGHHQHRTFQYLAGMLC
ncbi:uncharacterized protein [Branchiostoma lanceolatum]|uniref:uncharacterized protein isoform X3 n=1 Tax=Branchiostoma lanceolatum TaxID=7740 RepID=UPI003456EF70